MNFLAHCLLADHDPELELGGFMGDFVRGKLNENLAAGVLRGIRLHRAIDVFTDQHAEVLAAKALFDKPWRRYAGIMLDVWFDYYLANEFARWSDMPLIDFSSHLQDLLHANQAVTPPALIRFSDWMDKHDLPFMYASKETLQDVFKGISTRLRHVNPLADAVPVLSQHEVVLKVHFDAFFPELVMFARDWRLTHD